MNLERPNKQYICLNETCNKQFKYQSHYQRHLSTHENQRPFTCNFCPHAFKRQDALTVHLRVHTQTNPYQCSHTQTCQQNFKSKSALRYHLLKEHEKKCKFECDFENCQKKFLTLGQLKQHWRTSVHGKLQRKVSLELSNYRNETQDNTSISFFQRANVDDINQNEVIEGFDVFQFSQDQSRIIDDLWHTYKVKNENNLSRDGFNFDFKDPDNHELMQTFEENDATHYQKLKTELFTVVGLVDKIYRDEDNKKVYEPEQQLFEAQVTPKRIKKAIYITKTCQNQKSQQFDIFDEKFSFDYQQTYEEMEAGENSFEFNNEQYNKHFDQKFLQSDYTESQDIFLQKMV